MQQWRLPGRLREISGLALSEDGRLFAIEDERAIVYELDADEGRLIKAFALGDPVLRADIEGVAVLGETFVLVTSDGELLFADEGEDGEQVPWDSVPTGLGATCEVEGLDAVPGEERLLIACKEPRDGGTRLFVHSWTPADGLQPDATIELPMADILTSLGKRRVNPSGIVVDAASGNLLLVAARQRALVELEADGTFVRALRLPLGDRHHQPEGIELGADGKLVIADEGGNRKARLAVYRAGTLRPAQE